MKLSTLRRLGFTLIELLVVISIIGILASLAIPAVTGALTKGQMTGTLNNARQLHLATFNINLEQETSGQASAWPGSNSIADSYANWVNNVLLQVMSTNDVRKLLSAPRVSVTNLPGLLSDIAYNVYRVGDVSDETAIFLTTKNWDANDPSVPTPSSLPFGDKGFIIMRKGGDGLVVNSKRNFTNTNFLAIPTNQPVKISN